MNSTKLNEEKAAIENCEKQVLHDIEWIQPYGYLLACNVNSWLITHASANILEWFPFPIERLIGSPLGDFIEDTIVHQCKNAAGHSTITTQREHVGRMEKSGRPFDVFVHKKSEHFILELQPTIANSQAGLKMLDIVQRILARLSKYPTAQDLMVAAVGELRAITHFHRVKTYRFLSDGAGEVIAESREPQVDSFLGLRFPAMDVPQAAKVLYASTPIRIIPSIEAEQIPILAEEVQPPVDLSLALFRGVVPVHILYLKNMGVKATLSLPIVVNGEMWGLFACHHMEEHMLSSEVISALEILGNSISMMLGALLQREQLKRMEQCTRLVTKLFVPDESALGYTAYWQTASPELATLIHCDGLALYSPSRMDHYGSCPSQDAVDALANQLDTVFPQEKATGKVIALDSIVTTFEGLNCGDIAGVLAIPQPAPSYDYLLFFRRDASQNVRWAGAPDKTIEKSAEGFRLNPRASFAEYIDSTQKRSDAFSDEELIVASALKNALTNTQPNLSLHTQHRERLGLIIRELNHRVRNILALVNSIVTQSKNSSHDMESFIAALEKRIEALSETHKLLSEFDWKPIDIHLLLQRALSPYPKQRIQIKGDNISLPPQLASLLALVIHELASNAAKYGALASSSGQITLEWSINSDKLSLCWQEAGGQTVNEPTHQGFGTTLIKEALTYEFDADCQLHFLADGLQAKFIIPQKELNIPIANPLPSSVAHTTTSKGYIAIVLEDDYVIAKDNVSLLERMGFATVDCAPSIERAKQCIANKRYDFALLDANVREEFSGEVATLLQQQGVPFAFATGYGSKDQELRATACIDVLSKPINPEQLLTVLKQANINLTP